MKQSILLLIASLLTTHAFQTGIVTSSSSRATAVASSGPLFSAVAEEETAVKNDLLKRDRYVATNRFTVRQGRAAKFEKRWGKSLLCAASCFIYCVCGIISHVSSFFTPCLLILLLAADRSSRLAELDGFKYFQLMRRVALDDEANSGELSPSVMIRMESFQFFFFVLIFFSTNKKQASIHLHLQTHSATTSVSQSGTKRRTLMHGVVEKRSKRLMVELLYLLLLPPW